MTTDLHDLGQRLIGTWTTDATHPALPGAVLPADAGQAISVQAQMSLDDVHWDDDLAATWACVSS